MRFGTVLLLSTIVHFLPASCTVSEPYLDSASNRSTESRQRSLPVLNSASVISTQPTQVPVRTRLWSQLHGVQLRSRQRAPDRRLFFSFNQMLLSLIAPRLMRYQFDLMMHSVVAELFRKVLVPSLGTIAGGESGSILGSIGNLFRQRQPVPKTTTAAPNVDVQRLLDNAQKLITLQTLLRNSAGGQSHRATSKATGGASDGGRGIPHSIEARPTTEHPDATQPTPTDHPVTTTRAVTFSPIDFISFLQNNLKIGPSASNYNTSEAQSNAKNRINQVSVNHQTEPKVLSATGDQLDTDQPPNEFKLHSKEANQGNPSQKTRKNHRARLEDFKMSHLTYIDTEVPNYGNQLLIRDQEESSHNELHNHAPEMRNHAGFDSLLIQSDNSGFKSNEDLERANRWNDVLTNMNRFG